jgi:nuclear pore complex protein Nup98-Nup96
MSMTPPGGTANGTALNIFIPREDPRRLFVRDPLPSTQGSYGPGSVSPAMMMMGGSGGGRTGNGGGGGAMTPAPVKITGGGGDGTLSPRNVGTGVVVVGGIGTNGRRTAGGRGAAIISPSSQQQQGGGGEGGRYVDEGTVASHLPHLTRPDYYCEPSLPQLAAMAREDLSSLTAVSNFTVGRKGVGSVRWLDGTDVTGLDIDSIISLEDGSVEVYLDVEEEEGGGGGGVGPSTGNGNGTRKGGPIQKPEVGIELNKPAEVTMLNVFKIDKATGKPTTDAEALERFTRKLRRLTSDQGAKFISYDAVTGTWKFEVEHFSKYGLIDGSDDDDDYDAGGKQQGRKIGTVGMTPAAGVFKGSSSQLREEAQQQEGEEEEEDSDDADVAMLGLKSAVRRRHEGEGGRADTMTGAAGRKKRQAGCAASPPQSEYYDCL